MPVLYSLGNFAFGSPGRFSEKMPGYGLVADSILDDHGFSDIQLTCIVTDNSVVKFQPRPCGPGIARGVIKGLGPAVKWEHGKGVVRSEGTSSDQSPQVAAMLVEPMTIGQ